MLYLPLFLILPTYFLLFRLFLLTQRHIIQKRVTTKIMTEVLHPLHCEAQPPRQFTYPFCYEPHPLCIAAAKEVQRYIEESGVWAEEKGPGKMFGVLCVRVSESESEK